jgi:hypothetical protein
MEKRVNKSDEYHSGVVEILIFNKYLLEDCAQ